MQREVLTFVLVGAGATVTHVLVAIILEGAFGFAPQLANIGGYLSAVGWSYVGHGRFTFRVDENHAVHLPRFVVVSLVGLALGAGLVEGLNERLGIPFGYTMLFVGGAVASTTFVMSKLWAFARSQQG